MNIIHIFRRKETVVPKVGELWELKPYDKDPFNIRNTSLSKILELKHGWVRYQIGDEKYPFNDERMDVESFVKIYKKRITYE